MQNLLERRSELAKYLSKGISLSDAASALAEKYKTSSRSLYRDWQSHTKWMPILLGLQDKETFLLEIFSNHKEIYRLAAREYLSADNSSSKIGALP